MHGEALRSLKAPGTAYDDPALGKDPQPAHMDDYVRTIDDNGGVHINSGIPNHAFYLAATAIGGNAWDRAGRIWYAALTGPGISADCDFATFAGLTVDAARSEFGEASPEADAVETAWRQVGVLGEAGAPGRRDGAPGRVVVPGGEGPAEEGPWRRGPVEEGPVPEGEAPVPEPEEPVDGTEVFVRRTGGFAGLTRERSVRLEEPPGRRPVLAVAARRPPALSPGRGTEPP